MAKAQKRLGDQLVEWGIISQKEVTKALDHAKAKNLRIGEALIDLKLCSESNVYKALAAQHNMEYVEVDRASVPANATSLVPEDLMRLRGARRVRISLWRRNRRMSSISKSSGSWTAISRRPFSMPRGRIRYLRIRSSGTSVVALAGSEPRSTSTYSMLCWAASAL